MAHLGRSLARLHPLLTTVVPSSTWNGNGEHACERGCEAAVASHAQAAGAFGGCDRFTAEADVAKCRHVGVEDDVSARVQATADVDALACDGDGCGVAADADAVPPVHCPGRVERRLAGEHHRADAEVVRRGDLLAAAPAAELDQDGFERAAAVGEVVDRDAERFVLDAIHEAGLIQVAQPLGQHVGADAV